jgi:hypothetical protein
VYRLEQKACFALLVFFGMCYMQKNKIGCSCSKDILTTPSSNSHPRPWPIEAQYYQHFDADFSRPVPEETMGGWKKKLLNFSRDNTAIVSMHVWNGQTPQVYGGWWRCAPWLRRATQITTSLFPQLFSAIRNSDIPLFHIAGGPNGYWKKYPGYQYTLSICPDSAKLGQVASDPLRDEILKFKSDHAIVGRENIKDVEKAFSELDFAPQAAPLDNEPIVENSDQLFALCRAKNINHLIYCGFCLNWCLLLSPGGMAEISKYGILCSTISQATTAVENRTSAADEREKESALWRVALEYGFVFDFDDIITALNGCAKNAR